MCVCVFSCKQKAKHDHCDGFVFSDTLSCVSLYRKPTKAESLPSQPMTSQAMFLVKVHLKGKVCQHCTENMSLPLSEKQFHPKLVPLKKKHSNIPSKNVDMVIKCTLQKCVCIKDVYNISWHYIHCKKRLVIFY